MESGYGRWTVVFFLPVGIIEKLESEVFFLMETMQQSYDAIMVMPYSRRARIVERKGTVEKTKANAARNVSSGSGRRRVRR